MNTSMTPDMGEAALFLVGVLLSLLLLFLLFLPFVTRFTLPRFARVGGLDAEATLAALRAGLPRAGMVVVAVETGAGGTRISARRAPNIFWLTVHPAEAGAALSIEQEGLDAEALGRMTVLTGTALGYAAVKIHRILSRAGGVLRWHLEADAAGPGRPRPVTGVRRIFVQLSPWH